MGSDSTSVQVSLSVPVPNAQIFSAVMSCFAEESLTQNHSFYHESLVT